MFRVGDGSHRNNIELGRFGHNRSNVWTYPGVNTFGKGRMEALASHPTVKPVALVADALLDCSARGDIALDQFVGSGTTILAAEKIGRIGFGMEYEPAYVDVAIKRWQTMTRLEATLAVDGRTFEEIATECSNKGRSPTGRAPHVRNPLLGRMCGTRATQQRMDSRTTFRQPGGADVPVRRTGKKGDHAVGYGRPPKETQFVAGQSGNPRGRPRGARGVGDLLGDLIRQKIPVTDNGKTRKMPVFEVMLRRLLNDAMRGDAKAVKLFLSLADRYVTATEAAIQSGDVLAEDEAILSQYLKDLSPTLETRSSPNQEIGSEDNV